MNGKLFPPNPGRPHWQREPRPFAVLPSCVGVVKLLETARTSGLQWPKLWLQLPNGAPVRVTVAGDRSSTPGYLVITDGGPYGSSLYYGKISPSGVLEMGRDCIGEANTATREALVALLDSLARDPAGTAAHYGHLSGSCAFCSLPLKDSRSVEVGYGQRCAQRFGMPWGGKTQKGKRMNLLGDM
jgi:hypothetical protein